MIEMDCGSEDDGIYTYIKPDGTRDILCSQARQDRHMHPLARAKQTPIQRRRVVTPHAPTKNVSNKSTPVHEYKAVMDYDNETINEGEIDFIQNKKAREKHIRMLKSKNTKNPIILQYRKLLSKRKSRRRQTRRSMRRKSLRRRSRRSLRKRYL